jgi:Leucine-rich repeat (LRR) protein
MNFNNNNNLRAPGYYNITGPLITNPIQINLDNNNVEDFELELYLVNNNFHNDDINNFLPFPINLSDINCSKNNFTLLPQLPESLQWLNCSENNFTELPILPNELEYLFCDNNQISIINSLPSQLITLECKINLLERLPDSLPNTLEILNVYNNLLVNLPLLPNSLEDLNCSINKIDVLRDLPDSLTILECHDNLIENITHLPANLKKLDCTNNSLTSLPVFPDSLRILFCRGNNFDEETVSRIIKFYENTISSNPSFQEELDYFTTRRSMTTSYVLENQNVEIPTDTINKVREYANLRLPGKGGKKTLKIKPLNKKKSFKKKKQLNKKHLNKKKSFKKK